MSLEVEFCGVKFPNPFVLSSAPPTTTGEMIMRAFDAGWGGAVTKTLVLEKVPMVNVSPRLTSMAFPGFEDEPRKIYGFLNIELASDRKLGVWLDEVREIREKYPDRVVIASIMADAAAKEDWQELTVRSQEAGAQMIEMNFSCPHGGMPGESVGQAIGQDPRFVSTITAWVKEVATVPVLAKLTPNVTDITVPGLAARENGADGFTAINTVNGLMGVDLETLELKPSVKGYSAYGGYSGPGIKPIALKCVAQLAAGVGLPVSGVGGISTWQDAAEFLLCGATTLQVCSAVMMSGFDIIEDLNDGLEGFLEDHGFASIAECAGAVLPKIKGLGELDTTHRVVSAIDMSLCVKCDLCYKACRDAGYQSISLGEERVPHVDEEKCTGCSLCAQVCPVWDCVSMKRVGG